MAFEEVTYVSTFTIGKGDDDWAVYEEDDAGSEVGLGADREQIMTLVQEIRKQERRDAATHPYRDRDRPERNLDIYEKKTGKCLYIFKIAERLEDRLGFVQSRPFIPLPLNSEGDWETFIIEWGVLGETGHEAYFICDLKEARRSNVAKKIKDLNARDRSHGPKDILNIPFSFNVVDPLFKASPWVVPGHEPTRRRRRHDDHDHDHDHDHGHSHRHGRIPPLTHGGVHPPMKSILSVEL